MGKRWKCYRGDKDRLQTKSDCLFFLNKAGDTRHRNWYQKLVTETVTRNLHEKFDTSSSQLITVFGARKMADNIVDAAAALTAVSAATLGLLLEANEKKRRRKKSIWVQQWILARREHGAYHALLRELQMTDPLAFRNFLRMDASSSEMLLARVSPRITRQTTVLRQRISAEERLALSLHYLATGVTISRGLLVHVCSVSVV